MMPSPSIYTYSNARHSYRLSAGIAQARIAALTFNSCHATNPVALPADRSFTPTHATLVRRKPIAATASIQPQQARTCGKIPIAPAAPPPHTSRDFVPWRFLDAGYKSARIVSASRRPKTCTEADMVGYSITPSARVSKVS